MVSKVGDKSFALDFGKAFGAAASGPRPTPDPQPSYKSEYLAKVKRLNDRLRKMVRCTADRRESRGLDLRNKL